MIPLRTLHRAPGFAATAVLVLALGIGLATAVFTVADALLLRKLPVRDQERVVMLSGRSRDGRTENYPLGIEGARDVARRTRSLAGVAYYTYEGATPQVVMEAGGVSRLRRALVSGNFFDVLGARPMLGRALGAVDDRRGAAPVVVLSHRAWQDRFGADQRVIGRRLVLHGDGRAYTIVGVMPRGLDVPRGTDFWAPALAVIPEQNLRYAAVDLIARLAPGATAAAARDELTAYFSREGAPAYQRELVGAARSLPRLLLGDTRIAVLVFAAAAALLLVVTCVNVANLLLVRGIARAREFAIRIALGASRGRVMMQLLAEHAVLALAGGALGIAIATGAIRVFLAFAPASLPRIDEVRPSVATLGAALAITSIATLLFAVVPAFLTSRVDAQETLRAGTRQGGNRRARRLTEALVAAQVALAVLVLAAAALLGRSFVALERAELAFDPARLLVAELELRADAYQDVTTQQAMLERLLPAIRAIPGVAAATPVVAAPFSGTAGWDGTLVAEGQSEADAARNPMLNMELVPPSYFETLALAPVRGRIFTDADREGAPPVVVLSESAARQFWPGDDPIGKRLTIDPVSRARWLTVVGVVPDTRYRDLREARASIYFPLRQSFFPFAPTTLAIRTTGAPAAVVPALRRVVSDAAPGVVVASATSFTRLLESPLAQPRLHAMLLAIFAGAALLLAAVGLFGAVATMVRQRTREIGVRMALGATSATVARMVLGRGLRVAAAGGLLGLVGALVTNRALAALLFEVSPTDTLALGAVTLALLLTAAVASGIPAWWSARVDPVEALRAE